MIKTTDNLEALVGRLEGAEFVTIDTEFIRDTTYWPRLCLVQLAGPEGEESIIDPLADGLQLEPLLDLLADSRTVKVFHAARQDVEIFYHRGGVIPEPLFDTQVAAMVCGYGESVSYENLVRGITGHRIDKSSRFTDWSRRPLSERQLNYALSDVTHLREIYRTLRGKLDETEREHWLEEELAVLQNPETYTLRPEDAWRRIKSRNTNRRFLAVLRAVAAWREREAQERDVPRNRVMKDDGLLEIAANAPASTAELDKLRGVPRGFSRSRAAAGLVKAVAKARDLDKADLPEAPRRAGGPSAKVNGSMVDLLRVLLKLKCEKHHVAQKLVATAADLERIAAEDEPDVPALHGWRARVFGEDARALKEGRLALALEDGKAVIVER
ncbi:MAG: ribonuclease D [Alphaproteobacteria bacterium]